MRKDAPLSELIDILRQEDGENLHSVSAAGSSQSFHPSSFLATRASEESEIKVCSKSLPLSEPKALQNALKTNITMKIDQEIPVGSSACTDSDASHTSISPAVLSIDTNASSMLQEYERFEVQTTHKFGNEVLEFKSHVTASNKLSTTGNSDDAQAADSTVLVASSVCECNEQLKTCNNQKNIFNEELFLFTPDSAQDLSFWG